MDGIDEVDHGVADVVDEADHGDADGKFSYGSCGTAIFILQINLE